MLLDSPIIPNNSRKLPRLQVASMVLAFPVGGFGTFTISSRLVLDVCLRQLPIAKYSYAESIPPFLLIKCCARLAPDLLLTGNEIVGRKMLPIIPAICSVLVLAYYSPNYV